MDAITLALTEEEAKIYEIVMKRVDETAVFLSALSYEKRLNWLTEHQYPHPISFEREIGGTVYAVNAHFSGNSETAEEKIDRILGRNIVL